MLSSPVRLLSLVLISCAALALTGCYERSCPSCPNQGGEALSGTRLDVNAQANVSASPDVALISAGIITIGNTAGEALKQNSAQMNAVFEAIAKHGVAKTDVQTSGFNISPQYVYAENEAPRISGYQTSNTVNIKVRDLDKIGPLLDVLVAQGANNINGPNFIIDNTDALLDEARNRAVEKARAQAELYAKAAGLKVKRIISINEQVSGGAPPMPMMMAKMEMADGMAAAPTPVAAGEVKLDVTVNMAFELE